MVGNLNALVSSRRDKFIYNFQKVAPGKFPFYINSATGEIFVISQLNETNQVWSKLGFLKGYEKWKRIFRLCSASYNHYFLRLFWGVLITEQILIKDSFLFQQKGRKVDFYFIKFYLRGCPTSNFEFWTMIFIFCFVHFNFSDFWSDRILSLRSPPIGKFGSFVY